MGVLKINISHPLYQEGKGVCNQKTQFLELLKSKEQIIVVADSLFRQHNSFLKWSPFFSFY